MVTTKTTRIKMKSGKPYYSTCTNALVQLSPDRHCQYSQRRQDNVLEKADVLSQYRDGTMLWSSGWTGGVTFMQ